MNLKRIIKIITNKIFSFHGDKIRKPDVDHLVTIYRELMQFLLMPTARNTVLLTIDQLEQNMLPIGLTLRQVYMSALMVLSVKLPGALTADVSKLQKRIQKEVTNSDVDAHVL